MMILVTMMVVMMLMTMVVRGDFNWGGLRVMGEVAIDHSCIGFAFHSVMTLLSQCFVLL